MVGYLVQKNDNNYDKENGYIKNKCNWCYA